MIDGLMIDGEPSSRSSHLLSRCRCRLGAREAARGRQALVRGRRGRGRVCSRRRRRSADGHGARYGRSGALVLVHLLQNEGDKKVGEDEDGDDPPVKGRVRSWEGMEGH